VVVVVVKSGEALEREEDPPFDEKPKQIDPLGSRTISVTMPSVPVVVDVVV
jgi:hypothetical protein